MYTPLDEKPKAVTDPRHLGRSRDIEREPRVSLLVDRWDEDWSRLAWLRVEGDAELVEETNAAVIANLRAKYPQYRGHDLESRPLLRIVIRRVRDWGPLE